MASVTKTITSAIIGIAIEEADIQDVDEPLFGYFPGYSYLVNDQKELITIKNLITMTTGFEWDEWSYAWGDSRNDLYRQYYAENPVQYILEKPVVNIPGTTFNYISGVSYLICEIFTNVIGKRFDLYAHEKLFQPLGISNYNYGILPNYPVDAHGGLKMVPRDMAKFGFLYINNGNWNNTKIISEKWIEDSIKEFISVPGYSWVTIYYCISGH